MLSSVLIHRTYLWSLGNSAHSCFAVKIVSELELLIWDIKFILLVAGWHFFWAVFQWNKRTTPSTSCPQPLEKNLVSSTCSNCTTWWSYWWNPNYPADFSQEQVRTYLHLPALLNMASEMFWAKLSLRIEVYVRCNRYCLYSWCPVCHYSWQSINTDFKHCTCVLPHEKMQYGSLCTKASTREENTTHLKSQEHKFYIMIYEYKVHMILSQFCQLCV